MKLTLREHQEKVLQKADFQAIGEISLENRRVFRQRFEDKYPFFIKKTSTQICIQSNYFVGVDWLVKNQASICVEPKINENQQVDVLKMVLDIHSQEIDNEQFNELLYIDWEAPLIDIEQRIDNLTPFLVVQFLKLLKKIVQKGLKKSHYQIQENLSNKIKGKLLVHQQVKQNVFRNQFTKNYCEFPYFGEDNLENRFLKKVLNFSNSYIDNNKRIFGDNFLIINSLKNFSSSSFEKISDEISLEKLKNIKKNPFFKEYTQAIDIGEKILKLFSYNITKTIEKKAFVPPFWIDMPKLFELFVCQKLREAYSKKEVWYHFSPKGNELDFLHLSEKMVIDAKYKTLYKNDFERDDIWQVVGYSRLKAVYEKLQLPDNELINCLIVYPDETKNPNEKLDISQKEEISVYQSVFKLGIGLPFM